MWCPKCKSEYREAFSQCSDCGCALICEKPKEVTLEEVDLQDLVFLCDAASDFDADIKIALLRSYNIKAFKRYSSFASVAKIYCGSSRLGVKLYVPSENYEEAKEIIDAPVDQDDFIKSAYGENADEEG